MHSTTSFLPSPIPPSSREAEPQTSALPLQTLGCSLASGCTGRNNRHGVLSVRHTVLPISSPLLLVPPSVPHGRTELSFTYCTLHARPSLPAHRGDGEHPGLHLHCFCVRWQRLPAGRRKSSSSFGTPFGAIRGVQHTAGITAPAACSLLLCSAGGAPPGKPRPKACCCRGAHLQTQELSGTAG